MTTDKYSPFYLVWNPNGRLPQFRHESRESAEVEAARLAREHNGQTFFVCAPIYSVTVPLPLVTEEVFEPASYLPF